MGILALAAPAAGFSFGNTKTSAQTYVSPSKDMPGAYGWAAEKGLAYSFGKPFSQQKFPDLVNWVQEAEIKHARVAMLAALGYPVAEVFHPLWGGSINEPSLIAFQATPLQTFWPIVVGAIGLIESASYISDMKGTARRAVTTRSTSSVVSRVTSASTPSASRPRATSAARSLLWAASQCSASLAWLRKSSTRRATSSTRTRTRRAHPITVPRCNM